MCKSPWERKSPQWFQTMENYEQNDMIQYQNTM